MPQSGIFLGRNGKRSFGQANRHSFCSLGKLGNPFIENALRLGYVVIRVSDGPPTASRRELVGCLLKQGLTFHALGFQLADFRKKLGPMLLSPGRAAKDFIPGLAVRHDRVDKSGGKPLRW